MQMPLWDAGHAEARIVQARSLTSTSGSEAPAGSPQSAAGLAVQGRAAPYPDNRGALQAGAGQAPAPGPGKDFVDSEAGGQRAGRIGGGRGGGGIGIGNGIGGGGRIGNGNGIGGDRVGGGGGGWRDNGVA